MTSVSSTSRPRNRQQRLMVEENLRCIYYESLFHTTGPCLLSLLLKVMKNSKLKISLIQNRAEKATTSVCTEGAKPHNCIIMLIKCTHMRRILHPCKNICSIKMTSFLIRKVISGHQNRRLQTQQILPISFKSTKIDTRRRNMFVTVVFYDLLMSHAFIVLAAAAEQRKLSQKEDEHLRKWKRKNEKVKAVLTAARYWMDAQSSHWITRVLDRNTASGKRVWKNFLNEL